MIQGKVSIITSTCLPAVLWNAVFARENAHWKPIFLPATLTEVAHVGDLALEADVGARPHHRRLGLQQEPLLTPSSI